MAKPTEEDCNCDYSYTCEYHQNEIERERLEELERDRQEWLRLLLTSIAEKLGIPVPPWPKS